VRRRQTSVIALILFGWLVSSAAMAVQAGTPAIPASQTAPPAPSTTASKLPRVLVIATGGTIAAAGYSGQKQLTSEDLLKAVPQLGEVARISTEDPITVGSSQITPQMLLDLVRHVRKLLAADPELAGIVVTQGTDSLEETALFFDLLLATDRPVVFTAAMRLPTEIGSDGPRNLLNAVRIAASQTARGMGVLVTLNDEIHAAREVRKTHSSAVDAFQSTGSGPLGYVDEGLVFLSHKPLRRVTIDTDAIEPRVDLIVVTLGSDGHQVKAALDSGAKGIVLELFGRGNIPAPMVPELREALKHQVTLVFTTRASAGGRVLVAPVFQKAGVVSGQDLDGLKARMVLMAALGKTQDSAVIQSYFDRLGGGLQ
jgi:L-asparaginase